MCALIGRLAPDVLLCNELEAAALGGVDAVLAIGAGLTVVKHGSAGATVSFSPSVGGDRRHVDVPAQRVDGVRDTTGAGDAFAAGFLLALTRGADPVAAAREGHTAAATAIRLVSATVDEPAGDPDGR